MKWSKQTFKTRRKDWCQAAKKERQKPLSSQRTPTPIQKTESMEANINKILKQTEGSDQIKKDLNELAEKNKDDNKILLDIKEELTKY